MDNDAFQFVSWDRQSEEPGELLGVSELDVQKQDPVWRIADSIAGHQPVPRTDGPAGRAATGCAPTKGSSS